MAAEAAVRRSGKKHGRSGVAEYLKKNPRFFEDYADVIAEIFVPHPHGGHAIPIAERQIVTLREKIQDLEAKFKELVAYGTENDQISEKVHRSTLALFAAPDLETTLAVLYHSLKEDFGVPQVVRAAVGQGARAVVPATSWRRRLPRSANTRTSSAIRIAGPSPLSSRANGSRTATSCSRSPSCRCAPRRRSACSRSAAPIPIASIPGMGTLYQTRLAELASVATARFLPIG